MPLNAEEFHSHHGPHSSALPPPRWFGSGLRPHRPRAIYHPPPPEPHSIAIPPPRWFGSGLRPRRPRAIYHPPPPELQPEALRQQRLPPVREEAAAKADPNSSNYAQLSKKLNEGDIEGCKIAKEADRRERTAEIRREERPGPSTSACSRRASRTS